MLPFVLNGTRESIEYAIKLGSGTWASFPTEYEKKDGNWILKENFDRNSDQESRYKPQRNAPLEALLNTYFKYLGARTGGQK